MSIRTRPGLLCTTTFPSNTGYAWEFIEEIYRNLAQRLEPKRVDTWVAYPELRGDPLSLAGSPAKPVALPFRLDRLSEAISVARFVRLHRIRVVYVPDHPTWHPGFGLLRLAGARWIVVHDHTSGARTAPEGARRVLKHVSRQIRPFLADRVLAVSDFVARRIAAVDLVPRERIRRVWNFVPGGTRQGPRPSRSVAELGIDGGGPLIIAMGRATEAKGFQILFRAFDLLMEAPEIAALGPRLIYFGDGPFLSELRACRDALAHRREIFILGYVPGASAYLPEARLAVVPSLWEEAFGLSALEPMECGVPVIASEVGGIPEIVADGRTGLLVRPGDTIGLRDAMAGLLLHPDRARALGTAGRVRANELFAPNKQIDAIEAVVAEGLWPNVGGGGRARLLPPSSPTARGGDMSRE